ncbi:MAG: MmgE/PrpD family protein [bacterium]|nr:MmgE/PrpD family protein [bacterium]
MFTNNYRQQTTHTNMEVIQFIHETSWDDLPAIVRGQARRCLLDTVGAGISGRATELSFIIHDFAVSAFGGQGAQLWLDGREVSPPGAALANGMTIDALDIHDGHSLTKGHAGAAIVPGLLATVSSANAGDISGRDFLTTLVIGYEIALRAGIALHDTACDYHTSGAWNAIGVAALAARRLGLKRESTGHALGIAEYHGPRSQMMRCIDHPTMLKDGSGWGAMAGISAALLAQANFSGAPALTVESDEVREIWQDLGRSWQITRQYFKPHAVCRWAQPAMEAALKLQQNHQISPGNVKQILVSTFHEAVRLNCRFPQSTEEAQYSLPFPLAAALIHGRLGVAELTGTALKDPVVLRLCERVEMIEDDTFNQQFPAKRLARVEIETEDGNLFDSGEFESNWEASSPPSDSELRDKFKRLSGEQLPDERTAELEQIVWHCEDLHDINRLLSLIALPVSGRLG